MFTFQDKRDSWNLSSNHYVFQKMQEEIFRNRWQEEYQGYKITDSIYILPASAGTFAPCESQYIIHLDHHEAFGDGRHPTTELCLIMLHSKLKIISEERKSFIRMLDIGTGTGILSIAAFKMGIHTIDAFDIDTRSVESAEENAALNNCSNINFSQSDISCFPDENEYQLITANLLTYIIVPNIGRIKTLLSKDGVIIISGIGDQKRDIAENAFIQAKLFISEHHNSDGWNVYVLRK